MGTAESEIRQVELTIEAAKQQINRMNSLIKLSHNPEYKEIFLEGYFKDFAVAQVLMKADPSQQSEHIQASIVKTIDGIGSLRLHLQSIIAEGRQAEDALVEYELTKEELHEEDAV